MKTENSLENKKRFFALYFGQKILTSTESPHLVSYNTSIHNTIGMEYLELTPISQITDDHAIEICKICDFIIGSGMRIVRDNEKWVMYSDYNETPYETTTFFFHFTQLDVFSRDETGDVDQFDTERILMIIDFLRSKGYALSYLDLSVDDLVRIGWIKLKD